MAIKNVSGHQLENGDHVRSNIPVLEAGDLDGVEVTASGENYWRYICEHPDEIYTVTALNFNYETCPYILSGFLSGTAGLRRCNGSDGQAPQRYYLRDDALFRYYQPYQVQCGTDDRTAWRDTACY